MLNLKEFRGISYVLYYMFLTLNLTDTNWYNIKYSCDFNEKYFLSRMIELYPTLCNQRYSWIKAIVNLDWFKVTIILVSIIECLLRARSVREIAPDALS